MVTRCVIGVVCVYSVMGVLRIHVYRNSIRRISIKHFFIHLISLISVNGIQQPIFINLISIEI